MGSRWLGAGLLSLTLCAAGAVHADSASETVRAPWIVTPTQMSRSLRSTVFAM